MRPPSSASALYRKAALASICYPAEADAIVQYVRGFWDRPGAAPWEAPDGEPAYESAALPSPPPPDQLELFDTGMAGTSGGTGDSGAERYLGIVAPHIDLRASPEAYSWAFQSWRAQPVADTYLILGVGHHANVDWSLDIYGYDTPLGKIENNRKAVTEIVETVGQETSQAAELLMDTQGHNKEHSIEFPLICLQALHRLRHEQPDASAPRKGSSSTTAKAAVAPAFSFVPVLCSGLHRELHSGRMPGPKSMVGRLARALRIWLDAAEARGERVHIITSIDGCHQGPRFDHDYDVTPQVLGATKAWENELWSLFAAADFPGFFKFLVKDGNVRYFDGVGAMSLLLMMYGEELRFRRTCYRAAFSSRDHSAVTFSSGWLSLAAA
ncbi:MAG: AmmeMemoRadiSam system protein B [Candidatus Methylacidiphilales bacterium]|nr:AmmeMemoRadiSam system protein B [Candidatus Methylacidiphilales bacterium]